MSWPCLTESDYPPAVSSSCSGSSRPPGNKTTSYSTSRGVERRVSNRTIACRRSVRGTFLGSRSTKSTSDLCWAHACTEHGRRVNSWRTTGCLVRTTDRSLREKEELRRQDLLPGWAMNAPDLSLNVRLTAERTSLKRLEYIHENTSSCAKSKI